MSRGPTPVVLTIAGSDSSGGGGIQLDLRVLHDLGVHGVSAVTALTAQDTRGVRRVFHPPPGFVAEQIDAVAADMPIAAAKTGMLGRARVVEVVAERVRRREVPNLVVDPVLAAKDGTRLLSSRGIAVLKRSLLPRAVLVTPNLPEAEVLAGRPIGDDDSLREAARAIRDLGAAGVLIKGGHRDGDPVDTLLWEGEFHSFAGRRRGGPPVRGTGCALSAAIAGYLALGCSVPDACERAKLEIEAEIEAAVALGKGGRVMRVRRGG